MRFGMIRCSRSIGRDRHERGDEDEVEPDATARAPGDHDGSEERAGQCLGERIARRDRGLTRAAMTTQHQPRDDRHVVVRLDPGATAGARRRRRDQRQARGQPVGHDVEKRAKAQAADGGKRDVEGDGGH